MELMPNSLGGGGRFFKNYNNLDWLKKKNGVLRKTGEIVIGNDVWIGANVTVLSGVTVGDGAVIGAASVVTKDVPPYTIVAGNPARIIRQRFDSITIGKLLELSWWDYGPDILADVDYSDIGRCIDVIESRIKNGFKKYESDIITYDCGV